MTDPQRTILHVDLDAFFAAVEVREDPALRGRPVVVGADPRNGRGRGVVAAASYEARAFGIHSAMPISQAYRRCPNAAFLRPRMAVYAAASERFMRLLRRYTELVEPLSIDEAFLDITGSRALFGDGETIARRIKVEVFREEQLTASVGVAPTKFVAKIASDLQKPDGLVVVAPGEVGQFLAPLPVARLWGAGTQTIAQLNRLGARSIGDVTKLSGEDLVAAFGQSFGNHLFRLARGIDPRDVVPEHERKSVGRESTFDSDVNDRNVVERTLLGLVEEVARRLRRAGLGGHTVTVKLRTADFVTVTRQEALPFGADTVEAIWPIARRLLAKADTTGLPIRLVGVALSHFAEDPQLTLFESEATGRHRKVAAAMDAVTERFGERAVRRGALLEGRQPNGKT